MMKLHFADGMQKIWQSDTVFAACSRVACFENEVACLQLVVVNEGLMEEVRLVVACELPVQVRRVGYVPGDFTDHPDADDYVIAKGLHVFPDPLLPVDMRAVTLKGNCANVFYLTVGTGERMPVGTHRLGVSLQRGGETAAKGECFVEVRRGVLPACDIPVTDWMHYDCICDYYGVKPFSQRFFQLTESFWRMAAEHGINTVYVPLFTPPLDTKVGGERTTVQLIDVAKEDGAYTFGFSRLKDFLRRAEACGARYFEFSHLFTQWGAQAAPKIVVEAGGRKRRLFGWDTPADGAAYTAFLQAFLPAFGVFLRENGYKDRSFIHISDEPSAYWLEAYTARRALVKRLLPDLTHIDALSDVAFAERGLVDIPVAATDHAKAFIDRGKPFWAYYCFPQCGGYLSNRIMNMPCERTRVIGMQLFASGAAGFLHWGYNFYNTALSVRRVDPFFETDAGGAFESGDAFIVYPGADGAYGSLRLELIRAAVQDHRALQLLASLTGRENACALLKAHGVEAFDKYPHGREAFLRVREAIDRAIAEHV